MKQQILNDVLGFFRNEDSFKGFGIPWKRGIIVHGRPGNGKTATIKALAKAAMELESQAAAPISCI